MRIKYIIIGLMISLVLGSEGIVSAQEKAEELEKGVELIGKATKEIQGEVVSISNDYISVAYERDEAKGVKYEMLLPIDKNIRLVHKKNLKEIQVGDTVSVQYEEATVGYTDKERKGKQGYRRKAAVISFVKSATKQPEIIRREKEVPPEE